MRSSANTLSVDWFSISRCVTIDSFFIRIFISIIFIHITSLESTKSILCTKVLNKDSLEFFFPSLNRWKHKFLGHEFDMLLHSNLILSSWSNMWKHHKKLINLLFWCQFVKICFGHVFVVACNQAPLIANLGVVTNCVAMAYTI